MRGFTPLSGFYVAVVTRGFRRYATYRTATSAGVFTNTVFGLIITYTYIALWDQRPHLGGYTEPQALTYVWIGQALLATMALMGGGFEDELMERIRSGDIAVDLYRPADLQGWWLAADLGRAGFQLVGRGVAPLACGALVFSLALPSDGLTWLLFLVSALLGALVSFAVRFLVALSAFWLLDGAGVSQVAFLAGLFFSGMMLPLTVFPGWLGEMRAGAAVGGDAPGAGGRAARPAARVGRRARAGLPGRLGGGAARPGRLLQSVAARRVVVQGG